MDSFSHIDEGGKVRMVNVSEKQSTLRIARAKGFVKISAEALTLIQSHGIAEGNPLEADRIAGVFAAKNTARLIPLLHRLALTHLDYQLRRLEKGIQVEDSVTAEG